MLVGWAHEHAGRREAMEDTAARNPKLPERDAVGMLALRCHFVEQRQLSIEHCLLCNYISAACQGSETFKHSFEILDF